MRSIFIYHYFPDYSLSVGVLRAKRKRANTRQQLFYQLNYTRKNGLIKKSITRQKSLGRNS